MDRSRLVNISARLLMVVVFSVFVGCQSSSPDHEPEIVQTTAPPVVIEQPLYVAELGLSSDERLRKSIDLLALGDPEQAEVELQAYLIEIGDSKIASSLLSQISTPIEDLYPQEYIEVSLSDGESLSTIAKQYLGNALQFYGLARYNDIDEPGKTTVGQGIKVPLTAQAKRFLAAPPKDIVELDSNSSNPDIGDIVELDEAPGVAELIDNDQPPISLDDDAELVEPVVELSASDLESETSPTVPNGVAKVQQLLAEKNYKDAIAEFESQGSQDGFNPLILDGITDAYHREASLAFRHQDLDVAIELWEKVMALDPDHAHANNSLLQAQELKEKLKRLE